MVLVPQSTGQKYRWNGVDLVDFRTPVSGDLLWALSGCRRFVGDAWRCRPFLELQMRRDTIGSLSSSIVGDAARHRHRHKHRHKEA